MKHMVDLAKICCVSCVCTNEVDYFELWHYAIPKCPKDKQPNGIRCKNDEEWTLTLDDNS